MNIWLAISLIIAVVSVYMFSIEAFSVAFKLTGLATKKIKFQVASLFTGAGFTTTESELIADDDRRRKIAVACMYTGHIFSVLIMGLAINVLISVWMSLNNGSERETFTEWYFVVFYISIGLFLLVLMIKIPPVNRRFQKFLESLAIKLSSRSRKNNIITVLDYYGRYAVMEVILNKIPEFADETSLFEMKLTNKYQINIVSIRRNGYTVDVTKDTMLAKGDVIIMYGLISDVKRLFINGEEKEKQRTIIVDHSNELKLLNNYAENALMEVDVEYVPKVLKNVKMKDSHITDTYSVHIIIIKRDDKYIFVNKDTIIQKGDKVTLFGPYINIKHLFGNIN